MLQGANKSVQESANLETKSSAGDKYETSRAMIQLEKERLATQIEELAKLRKVLDQIDPFKENPKIGLGSVVMTEEMNYFMAASIGEIVLEDKKYFAISPVAPIGQALGNKKAGDFFAFRDKEVKILETI